MKIVGTQLRNGLTIIYNDEPYKIFSFEHRTPGKGNALMSVKMRNLITGVAIPQRFRPDEQIEKAEMEQQEMEYLYEDGDSFIFMNTENYEQIPISKEFLGDSVYFLQPNMKVEVEFFNGKPIGVKLPKLVPLKITETEPSLKGATAARQTKPATLESGLTIQVPSFIESGEVVNVDTDSLEYNSRVKE